MKFIDPNGHLYVGRYLDDGYSLGYYLAKLPAPKSQPTSSCTSSPDVCLTRGGNSQYTPMPVSGSPDRFLTNWGNNQYTPQSQPPLASTSTTATTTTTSTTTQVTSSSTSTTTTSETVGLSSHSPNCLIATCTQVQLVELNALAITWAVISVGAI